VTDASHHLRDWLESRLTTVDPGFAQAIRAALPDGAGDVPMSEGAEMFSAAATASLRDLLLEGCDVRASATKLLVVDALATYACEAMAYAPDAVTTRAASMMRDIASVLPEDDDAA
jgi:hypothetical protein